MKELTVNGISAGGQDYKEADRLVKLLTAEHGVIHVLMKGVKKEKAKLKFAAMPFSFCEYQLMERDGFYTVKTASEQGSLFDIMYDPDKYLIGSLMLEAAAAAMGASPAPDIFFYFLSGINRMLYSDTDAYSVGVNFVLRMLIRGGYYAETAEDAPFLLDIAAQETAARTITAPRLKRLVHVFQDKLFCVLKSATLL